MITKLLTLPLMVYVSKTDIKKRTIPDAAVLIIALLGLTGAMVAQTPWQDILWRLAPALALFFPAMLRDSVGGGDVKLCAALCLSCPPLSAVVALLLALAVASIGGKMKRATSSPFAPYLCGGFVVVWIWAI